MHDLFDPLPNECSRQTFPTVVLRVDTAARAASAPRRTPPSLATRKALLHMHTRRRHNIPKEKIHVLCIALFPTSQKDGRATQRGPTLERQGRRRGWGGGEGGVFIVIFEACPFGFRHALVTKNKTRAHTRETKKSVPFRVCQRSCKAVNVNIAATPQISIDHSHREHTS